jgi:hypothetical protein
LLLSDAFVALSSLNPVVMKRVVLLFPDTTSMAEFIMAERMRIAEVNSLEQTLIASMTDKQALKAETLYGAIKKATILKN